MFKYYELNKNDCFVFRAFGRANDVRFGRILYARTRIEILYKILNFLFFL